MLWVDKYKPRDPSDLRFHSSVTQSLVRVVQTGDFPHLIIYGPDGSGKQTRVNATLRALFGANVDKVKVNQKSITAQKAKKNQKKVVVDITTLNSNFHIQLTPSEAEKKDRYVVQTIIKEMAQSHAVNKCLETKAYPFKVVVLKEVDKLTKLAQQALRRTMEKYMTNCRLILVCKNLSKLIGPLQSRCLAVRVPAPSVEEISSHLCAIAVKEKLVLTNEFATKVAIQSDRNIRRAIILLEACKIKQYPFAATQSIPLSDWEFSIKLTSNLILQEQSAAQLVQVRSKLYDLVSTCVPPDIIIKKLAASLMDHLDDEMKHKTIQCAASYEHHMQCGSKPIFHLEAFVARFMAMYIRWNSDTFG